MTKQRFLADVMRHVPDGATVCVSVSEPFYYWQPRRIRIRCSAECFPNGATRSGYSYDRDIGGAKSRASANAKAATYQQWANAFIDARKTARIV